MSTITDEQVRAALDTLKKLWPEVSLSLAMMRAALEAAEAVREAEYGYPGQNGTQAHPVPSPPAKGDE